MLNNKQHVLIYLEQLNPRIEYVFRHIFKQIFLFDVEFTINKEYFISSNLPKISYCNFPLENELHLKFSSFFNQNSVEEMLDYIENEGFWKDKVAVSFALLTRLEEYSNFKKDKFGRFTFNESILFKKIEAKQPFVDVFAYDLLNELQNNNSISTLRCFFEQPTIDLDHPFYIKYKSLFRQLISVFSSLIRLHIKVVFVKIFVLLGFAKDKYDIYETTNKLKNIIYFLPLGNYSKIDSFHNTKKKSYNDFLQKLKWKNKIMLHPSYASNDSIYTLTREIKRFQVLYGETPTGCRQHYIKLEFPKTYQNLIQQGIVNDFSMGFHDAVGFRAGTCTPFYWFDLTKNQETFLKVFPFCWMDVTFLKYLKLSTNESKKQIEELKNTVKKYEGYYSYIFHNDYFDKFKETLFRLN
jgi:hypothetical protein